MCRVPLPLWCNRRARSSKLTPSVLTPAALHSPPPDGSEYAITPIRSRAPVLTHCRTMPDVLSHSLPPSSLGHTAAVALASKPSTSHGLGREADTPVDGFDLSVPWMASAAQLLGGMTAGGPPVDKALPDIDRSMDSVDEISQSMRSRDGAWCVLRARA